MHEEINIFGAGLAGLIAARMLCDHRISIFERQSSLPNNHSAVLRFRTKDVGLATNIPFRKVNVLKAVHGSLGPISDAMRYSFKVAGGYYGRSISSLEPSERYIAPSDLIPQLARNLHPCFDTEFEQWSHNLIRPAGPIISTIPVPEMMRMFGWKKIPDFRWYPGWTAKAYVSKEIGCDIYCTAYFPGTEPFYRASITGRELMVEGVGDKPDDADFMADMAAHAMGINIANLTDHNCKWSPRQKIAELDEEGKQNVKRFIMWLTEKHNIYSLGRLATWRPKLLLDDIPNDVNVIKRLIAGRSTYETRIKA